MEETYYSKTEFYLIRDILASSLARNCNWNCNCTHRPVQIYVLDLLATM